jgi:DNA polymerase-3 subunit delta
VAEASGLGPAYLIHGDDHGAIAQRRARLRALAEAGEAGVAAVEVIEGDDSSPQAAAQALAAMTLAVGRRVIIVEGAERWRDADVTAHLVPALQSIPPDTTIALFAREEQRLRAPAALREAVSRAGGQVVAQSTVKPWELSRWTREQAARLGLSLDAAAAKALVAQVGERQQRLLRELEKLALEAGSGATVGAEEIERRAARSAEWRTFALADALVAGDRPAAVAAYVRLRAQGERPSSLVYVVAQRLREALAIADRLRAGEPPAEIRRGLRMPTRAAERFLSDVARADPQRLRSGLAELADLELDSRGGAPVPASRTALSASSEDTLALRAIEAITA